MAHRNPTPNQPHTLVSANIGVEEEMVAQDDPFQSLSSREVGRQGGAGDLEEDDAGRDELSIKGTLLTQDVRADGCPERGGEDEDGAVEDDIGLTHPTDETSPVSATGSLRSGEFRKDGIVDCRCGDGSQLEDVQEKFRDMHVGERVADDVVTQGLGDDERDGQCHSAPGKISHSPTSMSETKQVKELPPNDGMERRHDGGQKGGGNEGGRVGNEGEASLFPMQSSDDGHQSYPQGSSTPTQQPGDSIRSLHSSHSEPNMATSEHSPPPSSSFSRSQSLQTSCRNEHYDILLIYTREDEKTCGIPFRSYAASKNWKVTSTAELPIGPLSLANFRKAMECCSYAVLLISPHFTSDRVCERHYNIAIQYGDKHPDFTDCVLPIIFGDAELPAELDAIQSVRWNHEYFDTVLTRSVDVQKRLDRELQEAARISSQLASRSFSIDDSRYAPTSIQRASTPPSLSTVPARIPMHGTETNQTITATQQPVRAPEQEACLMPSDQSPVLPPIHVATIPDVVARQSPQPHMAATSPSNHPQPAATASLPTKTPPAQGNVYQQATDYGSRCLNPPTTHATGLQQAIHQQHAAAMQCRPPPPETSAGIPMSHGSGTATPHNTQYISTQYHLQQHHHQQQHQSHVLPATYQPQATHQQHATHQQQPYVVPPQYLPSHYPLTAAMQPSAMDGPAGPQSILSPGPHTILHPAQDYMNMSGEEIFRSLSPERNPGQAASQMISASRFSSICELLDANDFRGFDWKLLAEIIGLSDAQIRILEQNRGGQTRALLEVFFLKNGMKEKVEVLEKLSGILSEMKRSDAADIVDREITIARCKRR